jgi:hypothetical protein
VEVWQSSYVNQSDVTSVLHNCEATVLGVGNGGAIGNSNFKAYNIDFAQRQFLNGQEVTEYHSDLLQRCVCRVPMPPSTAAGKSPLPSSP